jgi:WD40-like Beta Propeller Repeat
MKSKYTMLGLSSVTVLVLVSMSLILPIPMAVAAGPAGTGPDDALVPAGGWQSLGRSESRWYAFQYAGDGSQIEVRLEVVPAESVTFAVWTPEEIRRWRLGLEADPIGRGSADPAAGGALLWSGSFPIAGRYYVVVERSGSGPVVSYYRLEIRGSGVSLTTPTPTATPTPKPAKLQPKPAGPIAPTGKLVFQTTIGGYFYTINADGTGLRRITDGVDPIWSPAPAGGGSGGQQIAFTRWREPRGVWVVNADGSGERRVFDWSEARWPSWSADGTRLLFSRQHGGRMEEKERCFWGFCFTVGAHPHWKLGVVRLTDGDFREPPCSDYSLAPAWSPDASRIVYADEQGLRIQSEDGVVSYLVTHDARDTSPAWSPRSSTAPGGGTGGERVAFTRRQHDHWEVYVVDADGRNLKRLTDTPQQTNGAVGNSAAPAWSPDGQYLAFLTDRSGKWEMWVMRADGSGQRPMFAKALEGLKLEYGGVGERAISWTK